MTAAARSSLTDRFKAAFRLHPAGVALVICPTDEGPTGLTLSSLASVSARPPMLSFSVARTGSAAQHVVSSPELRTVLLGEHQAQLAADFAAGGGSRFTPEQGWIGNDGPGSIPRLETAPATIHGRSIRVIPAGESWLVLVEVMRVEFGPPTGPLAYVDRSYRSLTPLPLDDGGVAVGARGQRARSSAPSAEATTRAVSSPEMVASSTEPLTGAK